MARVIIETAQSKFGPFLCLAVVILLTFCMYMNSLNASFIWDDKYLVRDNSLIRDFRSIPKVFTTDLFHGSAKQSRFYRPLQNISYMFDYHISRLNPFTYHVHNVALHILNAVLIFVILYIFVGSFIAFITSLLFAVHPIHVEAVTYISGRADLLVTFFMLFSLFLYSCYYRKGCQKFYRYALFAFLCSLLSKELALVFPLAVFLFSKSFLNGCAAPSNRKFNPIWGFLFVDAAYILWRYLILGSRSLAAYPVAHDFNARFLFFLKSVIIYIKKLIIPTDLTMSYTVKLPSGMFDIWVLSSLVLLVAILSFLPYLYKRKRIIFFGIVWFFIFLLPQSNLFAINAFLADHFIYVSSIGFFLVISYLFARYAFRIKTDEIS